MKNTKNWILIKTFLGNRESKSARFSEIERYSKLKSKSLSQTLLYGVKHGELKRSGPSKRNYTYTLVGNDPVQPTLRPSVDSPTKNQLFDRLMDCIQAIVIENTKELIAEKDAEIQSLQGRLMRAETAQNRVQEKLFTSPLQNEAHH